MSMKLENLKIEIKNVISERADRKEIIRDINKEFLRKGFDLEKLSENFEKRLNFENLDLNETLALTKVVYDITKFKDFNYKKIFDKALIDEYEEIEDRSKYDLREIDKFQKLKKDMLEEKYNNERTRITYYNVYMKNLHYAEVNKDKDLMYFDVEELSTLIKGCIYAYGTTKQNMISFLSIYSEWCIEKGWIEKNQCLDLNVKELTGNSKVFLEEKIFGKTEFYNMLYDMEEHTKLPNLIPLLLARYGIIGNGLTEMINFKWEQIDEQNYVAKIYNKGGYEIASLPIDEMFLQYIKKAKLYSMSTKREGKNIIQYIDNGYVLKKAFSRNEDQEKTIKYNTVFNRVNDACKSIGIPRIPFKSLLMTRQIELLLERRKFKRLEQKDFEDVVELFSFDKSEPITNRAFHLKRRYEAITKDLVVSQRKNTKHLDDKDCFKIANNLKRELDLYV